MLVVIIPWEDKNIREGNEGRYLLVEYDQGNHIRGQGIPNWKIISFLVSWQSENIWLRSGFKSEFTLAPSQSWLKDIVPVFG